MSRKIFGLRIMSIALFMKYKKNHNTTPHCISCGSFIPVGEKFETTRGKITKYICLECSKKQVVVYQLPNSRKAFKGTKRNDIGSRHEDNWIYEIQSTTSM